MSSTQPLRREGTFQTTSDLLLPTFWFDKDHSPFSAVLTEKKQAGSGHQFGGQVVYTVEVADDSFAVGAEINASDRCVVMEKAQFVAGQDIEQCFYQPVG